MKRSEREAAILATFVLNPLPPVIRNDILRDESFTSRISFKAAYSFSLNSEISMAISVLNDALRLAVKGQKSTTIVLSDGQRMRARLSFEQNGTAKLLIRKTAFTFVDADLLSHEKMTRVRALLRTLKSKPLLSEEETSWLEIAKTRHFTDREYIELMSALGATPEALIETLSKPQTLTRDKLVPDDPRYYDRLIAPFKGSKKLAKFSANELADARRSLVDRNLPCAVRRFAFGSLTRSLVPFELLGAIPRNTIARLLTSENPFCLLFGFELASARIHRDKQFIGLGTKFLKKLFPAGAITNARCTIFCASAVLSIVRMRQVFGDKNIPLYWFRLAALAHAGVVTEALSGLHRPEGFLEWVSKEVGTEFLWHMAVDSRDAPRWQSEWISPAQLEMELIGRAFIAMNAVPEAKRPKKWIAILEGLRKEKQGEFLRAFFPGPLDDFEKNQPVQKRPPALISLEKKVNSARSLPEPNDLAALVYLERPNKKLAAKVLRIIESSPLIASGMTDTNVSLLNLCAHLAAATHSEDLARVTISECLGLIRVADSPKEVMDLANSMIVACSAYKEPDQYYATVGGAATNLVYSVPSKPEYYGQLRHVFAFMARRDLRLITALGRAAAMAEAEFMNQIAA